MAKRWMQARELRAFLDAVDAETPATKRDNAFEIWLRWARGHASQLDALHAPHEIAKIVSPDADQIRQQGVVLLRADTSAT